MFCKKLAAFRQLFTSNLFVMILLYAFAVRLSILKLKKFDLCKREKKIEN